MLQSKHGSSFHLEPVAGHHHLHRAHLLTLLRIAKELGDRTDFISH